ncbi:hypothetical protein PInf_018636 [Phytophthora infestans]|nr:hypothetical protein PInf_018636 [Phytophthora infestans]
MGVIEEIYCENFMCHRKLRVTLSPHINFITGENGSGKSAIIAAIQICFGASARTTHRGKNIKSFIRHGCDGNAFVRVTLRNDDGAGSDAFQADKYGKKIIVERLIRRDGSAEYRLKSEKGMLVSKLKSELEAMMDHLNIQTDNPCAVLDLDNAKLFLKGTSQDKYKFFLQSTDLAKMRATYTCIDETTRMIAESTLKPELAEIEAQSIGKLEGELKMLKTELAWSIVGDKDAVAADSENKLMQKQRDTVGIGEKLSESKREVVKLEQSQNEANFQLEDASARMSENYRQKMTVKAKIREARRPLQQYKAELSRLARSKDRAKQQLSRVQCDLQRKRERHTALLKSLTESNQDLRDRVVNMQQAVMQTERDLGGAEAHALAQTKQLIKENLHQFTFPPIGPLGMYVTLPDEFMRFQAAIEVAAGTVLRNYLVVNGQDKA